MGESKTIDDGGAAFPPSYEPDPSDPMKVIYRGLSKRDWFAGQALAGLFNHAGWVATHDGDADEVARRAYAVADAMLLARKAGRP